MTKQSNDWFDPRMGNYGSMPQSTGNLISGLSMDYGLWGVDPSGGIGNNFQDDLYGTAHIPYPYQDWLRWWYS
tara:strand:+ start:4670 stop:4888 length:219 start_codon:yes stop_codon:yes gene_type:complete